MASTWSNFKDISSRPLFTFIFRPEMLKFHPYSILTGLNNSRICHILCVKTSISSVFVFDCSKVRKIRDKDIENAWPHCAYSKVRPLSSAKCTLYSSSKNVSNFPINRRQLIPLEHLDRSLLLTIMGLNNSERSLLIFPVLFRDVFF